MSAESSNLGGGKGNGHTVDTNACRSRHAESSGSGWDRRGLAGRGSDAGVGSAAFGIWSI